MLKGLSRGHWATTAVEGSPVGQNGLSLAPPQHLGQGRGLLGGSETGRGDGEEWAAGSGTWSPCSSHLEPVWSRELSSPHWVRRGVHEDPRGWRFPCPSSQPGQLEEPGASSGPVPQGQGGHRWPALTSPDPTSRQHLPPPPPPAVFVFLPEPSLPPRQSSRRWCAAAPPSAATFVLLALLWWHVEPVWPAVLGDEPLLVLASGHPALPLGLPCSLPPPWSQAGRGSEPGQSWGQEGSRRALPGGPGRAGVALAHPGGPHSSLASSCFQFPGHHFSADIRWAPTVDPTLGKRGLLWESWGCKEAAWPEPGSWGPRGYGKAKPPWAGQAWSTLPGSHGSGPGSRNPHRAGLPAAILRGGPEFPCGHVQPAGPRAHLVLGGASPHTAPPSCPRSPLPEAERPEGLPCWASLPAGLGSVSPTGSGLPVQLGESAWVGCPWQSPHLRPAGPGGLQLPEGMGPWGELS